MTTFIYTLTDPISNLIRYVGKSNKPNKRLSCHLGRTEKNHKYCWLKGLKHKGLKPILEVLDEVPADEWRFWEIYWISQIKAWGYDLTNLTNGGEGFASGELNPAHLPHVKALRSKIHKGKELSDETKDKIRKSLTGRENPEHSKRMTGRKQSDDHKLATAIGLRGKNSSLNEEQVREIKHMLNDNKESLTFRQIGEKFGVSKDIIKKIKYNKAWTYVII